MERIIEELHMTECFSCIDDRFVPTLELEEHLDRLGWVLCELCQLTKVKLNASSSSMG